MKRFLLISLLLSTSLAYAHGEEHQGDDAIGKEGEAKNVSRTIKISMTDAMRFSPDHISAKKGETIRFVVTNAGKLKHEFVLGTEKELKEHYALMKKNPEMEHEDPNQLSLAPGAKADMLWQFTRAGKIDFACLQPGHYDAGMKGKIMVSAGKDKAGQRNSAGPQRDVAVKKTAAENPAASGSMSEGEVKKINKDTGRLTIKHGPLANLDMPAMTMVFHVKNPAMLDQVKEGDKIKFVAGKVNGAITVMKVEIAK